MRTEELNGDEWREWRKFLLRTLGRITNVLGSALMVELADTLL
jgi:hypothetical protein